MTRIFSDRQLAAELAKNLGYPILWECDHGYTGKTALRVMLPSGETLEKGGRQFITFGEKTALAELQRATRAWGRKSEV